MKRLEAELDVLTGLIDLIKSDIKNFDVEDIEAKYGKQHTQLLKEKFQERLADTAGRIEITAARVKVLVASAEPGSN